MSITPPSKSRPLASGFRRTSYLIKRIENEVRTRLDTAIRDFGITSGQYLTLSLVSREGGLSSAELARRSAVTPQSMNETISILEQKGLVERSGDRDNRRILVVALSREGRRVLGACDKAVDRVEAEYFGAIKPARVAELRAAIELLLEVGETAGR